MMGAWHLQREAESPHITPSGALMHRVAGALCNPRGNLWRCPQSAVGGSRAQGVVEFVCGFRVKMGLGAAPQIALLIRHSFCSALVVAACELCDPARGAPHPVRRTVSLLAVRDEVQGTPAHLFLWALASSITAIKFFRTQMWLERNRLWHC